MTFTGYINVFDPFPASYYILTTALYAAYLAHYPTCVLQEFQEELDAKAWEYDLVRTSCEQYLSSLKEVGEDALELEELCDELFFEWTDLSCCLFERELTTAEAGMVFY